MVLLGSVLLVRLRFIYYRIKRDRVNVKDAQQPCDDVEGSLPGGVVMPLPLPLPLPSEELLGAPPVGFHIP